MSWRLSRLRSTRPWAAFLFVAVAPAVLTAARVPAGAADLLVDEQEHDLDALPPVPAPFRMAFFAREPLISHPAALAFDAKGRLYVGGGPQFRKPTPQTPPDSVVLLEDCDGDGVAERATTFASGFNSIQGLAFKGGDLYVANAPDLTVVRDLDGDDVADEYVRLYEGLSHNRHGLHGLVFGPDGFLYMSQGNSQVQKHAPKAFRDLMGIRSNAPATQKPRRFSGGDYAHTFVPTWPEAEGGILRARPDGTGLEIFARGLRNPFDMDFDANFDWLATDNDDGPEHDRVITPFRGAHFGKRHPWYGSWTGEDSPATVPLSGLFPNANGSGVGVVFYTAPQWPEAFRNAFLVGDWIRKSLYVYRPQWQGAQRTGELHELFSARGTPALFRPTDMVTGPDGALYIAGWGSHYGSKSAPYQNGDDTAALNEGRVFKMWNGASPLIEESTSVRLRRARPLASWTLHELIDDLGHFLPARAVQAQDELLRRGQTPFAPLRAALQDERRSPLQRLWLSWTLGRLPRAGKVGRQVDHLFLTTAANDQAPLEGRIQALRIVSARRSPRLQALALDLLDHGDARLRREAAEALRFGPRPPRARILEALAAETDRLVRYALWKTLAEQHAPALSALLRHREPRVAEAALLALLERDRLTIPQVERLVRNPVAPVATLAQKWLERTGVTTPPLPPPATPLVHEALDHETTLDEVRARFAHANPDNGRALFFHRSGPGCYLCHKMGNDGRAVGPDLSDLASRASYDYVAESILDPNATLIEGFMQALVTTKDGREYAGMIREDTAKLLRLYQADGTTAVIPKTEIAQRELLDVSAMPSGYGTFLSPQDVADLVSWLMRPPALGVERR
ncbi:MAG: c-type cytochrome [Myxococcales bacterium]|nr:c-type cytochrome [Myxococcales bacterium]